MQIEEFRARLEEFDEALNREQYLHYSGLKASLETIRFYNEYSEQLRGYLCTQFVNPWFANRKTGMSLKEIWETGQIYSADELGKEIGVGPLDPQVLTDELLPGLRQ